MRVLLNGQFKMSSRRERASKLLEMDVNDELSSSKSSKLGGLDLLSLIFKIFRTSALDVSLQLQICFGVGFK